jgi:RNA polymerase sigma-70 factor (ECF subfamily)
MFQRTHHHGAVNTSARAPAPVHTAWDWADLRRSAVREARSLLSDPHDAEDAAQEAMVRAWRKRAACRSPEAPEGWLRQIARNEAFRRQAGPAASRTEPLADSEAEGPAEAFEELLMDRLLMRDVLARLGYGDRQLLLLRYLLDLPDVVIARRLGIAESTVRVKSYRLRQRIRVLMGELR